MADLDPEHVEAVAQEICPKKTGPCKFCDSTARRIIARPDAILAALNRIGVLREEKQQTGTLREERDGPTYRGPTVRRYVTRWEDIDA